MEIAVSRQLIIMRHAKSDWDSSAARDFDRPLAARGERDAPRMANWLREQQYTPQQVISSPALRARQTAMLVLRELGLAEGIITWSKEIYEAEVADLLKVLAECRTQVPVTLMVGHNPGLEGLVRHLGRPTTLPQEDKILPTAGLVVLELPDDWRRLRRQEARVVAYMRPRWLD
ncbi:MAG: SixA phosphatase family protein [Chromatiales bacterium]